MYTSKLKPLYTALLDNIKLPANRMVIKFDENHLAVEQKNCTTYCQSLHCISF